MRCLAYALCVAFLSVSGCTKSQLSDRSPEVQVVQQLVQRRVVMMGDFAHEFPLPYHGLVSTLNTWLAMLTTGKSQQRHVVLFLEEDGQVADLLRQYLHSADDNPLLDFLLPSTSIERLEFYHDIRRIVKAVDSLNGTLPRSRQITLEVEGPEARNILDPARIDSSRRASMRYFVKERDSLTARNVIAYLDDHPQSKALMFFGNAHLLSEEQRKDYSGILDPAEGRGMYLGYYLKRAFGGSQVFTISQTHKTQFPGKADGFPAGDVMYLSKDVPWKDSPPNNDDLLPENYDAFIIRDGFVVRGHPMRFAFSRRVVDAALRRLTYTESHQSGAMGNRLYQEALHTLNFLWDTTFATVAAWQTWCSGHPFKGLGLLTSEQFRERYARRSSEVLGTPAFFRYIDDLIDMGFDPRVGSRDMSRDQWNQYLAGQWPQLLVLNAIEVYWIGERDEQVKAKEYLVRTTSNDFEEPDLYLKWWRKRFFTTTY